MGIDAPGSTAGPASRPEYSGSGWRFGIAQRPGGWEWWWGGWLELQGAGASAGRASLRLRVAGGPGRGPREHPHPAHAHLHAHSSPERPRKPELLPPARSGHMPCLIEHPQPLAPQHCGHCPRLWLGGGGPGAWPQPARLPDPQRYCRMPEVKRGEALGCRRGVARAS